MLKYKRGCEKILKVINNKLNNRIEASKMEWLYKYISVTAIIGGLWLMIKYYIQKKIDSYFNSKLAVHKQELNDLTERTKYDLSRRLFDFEAYSTRKHEVYPVLYSKIFETFNKMREYQSDIEAEFNIDEDRIYDLTCDAQIDFDQDLLHYKYQQTYAVHEVHKNADDYYFSNELYFSKSVAFECGYVLKLMRIMITCYFDHQYNKPMLNESLLELEGKIEHIKTILHEELSYSHHEFHVKE